MGGRLATVGLVFDGYDLVVYGAVVSTFLREPSQIGPVSPEMAGALGSYALFGVLVGALIAGTVGDNIGRRQVMLASYAWFALGMALTALTTTVNGFGLLRFMTGSVSAPWLRRLVLGGGVRPSRERRTCANAIMYAGVPFGSLLAALLAILLLTSSDGAACSGSGRCRLSLYFRWRCSRCPSRWRGWQHGQHGRARGCRNGPGFRSLARGPAPLNG